MKYILFSLAFSLSIFAACNSPHVDSRKPEEPKALKDETSSGEIFLSKRGTGNMIDELYAELMEKTPQLKEFDAKINKIEDSKKDSTNPFVKFDSKNQAYFTATDTYLASIQDSVLRSRIKEIIASNIEKYKVSIIEDTHLLTIIDQKSVTLNDLYKALKLTQTLTIMEDYQKKHHPSTKSLEKYIKQQDEAIKQTGQLIH